MVATLLALILIVYIGVRWLISKIEEQGDLTSGGATSSRKLARGCALLCVALVIVSFAIRAASFAATNRLPRSDTNKNPVYQQMEELKRGKSR